MDARAMRRELSPAADGVEKGNRRIVKRGKFIESFSQWN
jgi:hypothetical protein